MTITRETAKTACIVLRDLINDGETNEKQSNLEAALDELEDAFLSEAFAAMTGANKKPPAGAGTPSRGHGN